jgi:hypothetical protein
MPGCVCRPTAIPGSIVGRSAVDRGADREAPTCPSEGCEAAAVGRTKSEGREANDGDFAEELKGGVEELRAPDAGESSGRDISRRGGEVEAPDCGDATDRPFAFLACVDCCGIEISRRLRQA